jgi:hypothetical protein
MLRILMAVAKHKKSKIKDEMFKMPPQNTEMNYINLDPK